MRRRSLLAGLSAALGAFAGCNTTGDESTDPADESTTGNDSTDPADTSGPTIDSEFAGMSIPDLPGENEVTWYHESDETTRGFVRPSTERAELPAQIDFTYYNRSEESTGCGHWNLYKLRDERWFHIGPYGQDGICYNLSAGESETWTIQAAAGEIDTNDDVQYPYLGGGRYAAVVGYGHATSESAAIVEFDAPPVSVVPTDDATSESDGATVTVTTDGWREESDSDDGDRATLTLERAQTADRTIIVEQVMRWRNRGYRNLLAFTGEDIERVVLRTDRRTADPVVNDDETVRFRYGDRAYRVTKGEP